MKYDIFVHNPSVYHDLCSWSLVWLLVFIFGASIFHWNKNNLFRSNNVIPSFVLKEYKLGVFCRSYRRKTKKNPFSGFYTSSFLLCFPRSLHQHIFVRASRVSVVNMHVTEYRDNRDYRVVRFSIIRTSKCR